jgi:pimeloyl-ACP methyl ester carboxylesterase
MVMNSTSYVQRGVAAGAAVLLALGLGACSSTADGGRVQILRDGRQMAFQYAGAEKTEASPRRVVLIHGAPADASSWSKLLETQKTLLSDCEVIAVDRLGYGGSMPARSAELEEDARSIEPFLKAGTILVGHSYGAPVALRVASAFPERVGGIVLVAGATEPGVPESRWAQLGDGAARSENADRELLALAEENQRMQPLLADVRCPVIIVHGDADRVCPHDATIDHLEHTLAGADVCIVSVLGGGHNLHRTHPRVIAEEISRLSDTLEPVTDDHRARDVLRGLRPRRVYRPCDLPAMPRAE